VKYTYKLLYLLIALDNKPFLWAEIDLNVTEVEKCPGKCELKDLISQNSVKDG